MTAKLSIRKWDTFYELGVRAWTVLCLTADLVLLDADPLAAIENTQRIDALVRAGRLLDRAALDQALDTAAARIQALGK